MTKSGIDTYGRRHAIELSLGLLKNMLLAHGIRKLYVKRLASNDNSKNQIYLGGNLSSLNIIPVTSMETFDSSSGKSSLKPGKTLMQGSVNFSWIDSGGKLYPAPGAKLILYPQYPEVRFSGFLRQCDVNASEWMDVKKQGRSPGRYLFMGIHPDGHCIGYISVPDSRITRELDEQHIDDSSLLVEIGLQSSIEKDAKKRLLSELLRIHRASPIDGKILDGRSGISRPYSASNGAGYTLEAELGVPPNGYAEPDYEGWEVKAHSGSVITLMTPEPSGGCYKSEGFDSFMRKYGYPDRNGKPDRLNFGGVHRAGERQPLTGLTMTIGGYSHGSNKIEPTGGLYLIDDNGNVAAEWSFSRLLEHWNKKHSKAVYVPYQAESLDSMRRYYYSSLVSLGEGTDFLKFLTAFSQKTIYFDPGIKLVGVSKAKPVAKKRSQFRIRLAGVGALYDSWETLNLIDH